MRLLRLEPCKRLFVTFSKSLYNTITTTNTSRKIPQRMIPSYTRMFTYGHGLWHYLHLHNDKVFTARLLAYNTNVKTNVILYKTHCISNCAKFHCKVFSVPLNNKLRHLNQISWNFILIRVTREIEKSNLILFRKSVDCR